MPDPSCFLQHRNDVSGCILPAVLGKFLLFLSHLFPLHRLVDGPQWSRLFLEWRPVSASAAVIRKQSFDIFSNVASSAQITLRKFCFVETHVNSFWRHLFCCIWQSNDYIKHTNTVSRFVAEDGHFGTKITCHNVQKQENILVFLFHPRIKFCLPFIHIIRKFQLYFHMTWSSFMAAFLKHHCCASFPLKTNSLHGVEGTMQPSLRE